LEYGQKYRWNMQAHNSAGWSAISNTLYFQTPSSPTPIPQTSTPTTPAAPTTTSPGSSSEPGILIDTLTPTLRWTSVSGADYYAVAISKYPYGSSNIIYNPQTVYGTSLPVPAGTLEYGQKCRWNMQAHNSAGWSAISNTLYFQTPSSPTPIPQTSTPTTPAAPTTTSPGSSSEPGILIDTLTPTLRWTSVSGADYYAVAISKYPYGSSNIIYNPQTVYGTSLPVPAGTLEYGQKYRWNMQAHNSAGWSAISNMLYFQTPQWPTPTPPTSPTPSLTASPTPIPRPLSTASSTPASSPTPSPTRAPTPLPTYTPTPYSSPTPSPIPIPVDGSTSSVTIRVKRITYGNGQVETLNLERDYLPVVVACENGGAPYESMKAQAIAARTVAMYRKNHPRDSTFDVYDSTGDQKYDPAETVTDQHRQSVTDTSGIVLEYTGDYHTIICAFFVSGTGSTEQYVTYNEGKSGNDITQAPRPFAYTTNPPSKFPDNRGCMGQVQANNLASSKGYNYQQILRYFYGSDIEGLPSPSPSPTFGLGTRAVELAKQVEGAPYLGDGTTWGGKGYLWNPDTGGWLGGRFVEPSEIKNGYWYWNNKEGKVKWGQGLDCSGLTFWAFNKAAGATELTNPSNPILPDGASSQWKDSDRLKQTIKYVRITNLKQSKSYSELLNELQQGDLIFFDVDKFDGIMDHVSIYIGGGKIIHARFDKGIVIDELYNLAEEKYLYEKEYGNYGIGVGRVIYTSPLPPAQNPIQVVIDKVVALIEKISSLFKF